MSLHTKMGDVTPRCSVFETQRTSACRVLRLPMLSGALSNTPIDSGLRMRAGQKTPLLSKAITMGEDAVEAGCAMSWLSCKCAVS